VVTILLVTLGRAVTIYPLCAVFSRSRLKVERRLVSQAASAADFPNRAFSPQHELRAYEALWARQDTGFKSIAEAFSGHAGAIAFRLRAKGGD
jgi:hypothetical protein